MFMWSDVLSSVNEWMNEWMDMNEWMQIEHGEMLAGWNNF